jgi:peptidyl-prolyl cis-trans isomerase B (cyclophilin B)
VSRRLRPIGRLSLAGVFGAALVAVAGCGGSGNEQVTVSAPPTSSGAGSAAAGPCHTVQPHLRQPPNYGAEPKLTIASTTYTATIVTNCGTIVAQLDGAKAPHTVNSFFFLAAKHYFDGTECHRLTTRGIYVLQCGDPSGTGTGGPGYTIPDENLAGATYPAGTLAMANTGQPHTGGSQFFMVYVDSSAGLSPAYTPFGHIVSGLDVLQAIAHNGDDESNGPGDGHPKTPVVIESFTVTKG